MTRQLPAILGLLALLTACSDAPPAPPPRCAAGTGKPMQVVQLFLGRAIHGRPDVTEREWKDFVAQVIAVNLPDGFTAFDAEGGWLNPATHMTIHERTKVLVVALPETADSMAAIARVRTAYQDRFHQQLVGMIVQPGCGLF